MNKRPPENLSDDWDWYAPSGPFNPEKARYASKWLSLRTLFLFYKGHLRARPLRELFAMLGIAAGVALLFAAQVANKSVIGSFEQLADGVAGRASLEVAARSSEGFDQEIFRKMERLESVGAAAPMLERRIAVRGPKGRRPLTLIGADERLGKLGGKLVTRYAERSSSTTELGLQLTGPTAKAIGVGVGDEVGMEVGEKVKKVPVAGILGTREVGDLTESPIALASLGFAQEVAGMNGRISRVLVSPSKGQKAKTTADLKKLAKDRLNVRPADTEAKLLQNAASADRQSTALFSAIALVVGVLLAYNAMLLSISDRRRFISSMHSWGYSDHAIVQTLIFDALLLGVAGSLIGLLLGDQLSRHVLHEVPGFLATAFAIGNQRVITIGIIAISLAGGIFAALAATARPAWELIKMGPTEAFALHDTSLRDSQAMAGRRRLFWAGSFLIAVSVATALIWPEITLFAVGSLVAGIVMVMPAIVAYLIKLGVRIASRTLSSTLKVSMAELRLNPARATALAATGALAMFAILAITGPARDIQRGVGQLTENFYGNADLWVMPGREENPFITQSFRQRDALKRIKRLPEVRSVHEYRGSFIDDGNLRLWVVATPSADRYPISPSQLVEGDFKVASQRLRRGGWVALTTTLAEERNLHIGEKFTLPTPSGEHSFRLAATVTNYGWLPGVVVVSAEYYAKIWKTNKASALEVNLTQGIAPEAGATAVQTVLGKKSSIRVQTTDDRRAEVAMTTRQGLSRLSQISTMVIIAVVLAAAAAMFGAAWQRRKRLWSMVSIGMGRLQLYRTIFLEAVLILLVGCLIGAAFGILGQGLGGRWLHLTTGSPVPFVPAWGLMLKTFGLITGLALVAVAIPISLAFPIKRQAIFSRE